MLLMSMLSRSLSAFGSGIRIMDEATRRARNTTMFVYELDGLKLTPNASYIAYDMK
jgi:hypothetical protein